MAVAWPRRPFVDAPRGGDVGGPDGDLAGPGCSAGDAGSRLVSLQLPLPLLLARPRPRGRGHLGRLPQPAPDAARAAALPGRTPGTLLGPRLRRLSVHCLRVLPGAVPGGSLLGDRTHGPRFLTGPFGGNAADPGRIRRSQPWCSRPHLRPPSRRLDRVDLLWPLPVERDHYGRPRGGRGRSRVLAGADPLHPADLAVCDCQLLPVGAPLDAL